MKTVIILILGIAAGGCNLGTQTAQTGIDSNTTPAVTKTLTDSSVIPSSTPDATEVPCSAPADWHVYIIQRGDTLSSIANRAETSVQELTEKNCLSNPDQLTVGQVIAVPRAIHAVEQNAAVVTLRFRGLAFDYPSGWHRTNFDVNAGWVGSVPFDELPPLAAAWPPEMAAVAFSAVPLEFVAENAEAWAIRAVQDYTNAERFQVKSGPQPVRFGGDLSGYQIEVNGPGAPFIEIFFIIDGQPISILAQGNRVLGESVLGTLRLES